MQSKVTWDLLRPFHTHFWLSTTSQLLSLTERPIVKTTNIIVITLTLLHPRIGLWRFSIFDTPDGAEPYSQSSNISRKEEWGAMTVRGASEGDASLPLIFILWKPKTNSSDRIMAGRQFFSFLKLNRKTIIFIKTLLLMCEKGSVSWC